ncbi:hypothetical protein MCOR27_008337 [Pyricularia oryzae]|uniref:Zn(2)-C6 fungal-type domain-containing protein n=2 Tax=Pyricularia TaxID=48558 RepID=A0ABQ8NBS9_PYRGI|nr:hypothetical protein MCOR01_011033 [Pyricularia oryzae]KAI6294446.1 hypothetical protein MCOR33_008420 [Pyricularia grisea]KAH9437910.1 hypothetical protein MCOR02_001554 [Pyricularia oryzae]KAI6255321.1 hypothetical protein MCOR19_008187 [Pyricularia oryzae]KAI6269492.1 hypothetical protein MCOR26_008705 [Pyricularia oryzae]
MVYCGKASQGCQSCRTRRIKCDKLKPECSQCRRVSKKCPGYRDQLSLMFRDESSKVMQKAHAQWGAEPAAGSGSNADPNSAAPLGAPVSSSSPVVSSPSSSDSASSPNYSVKPLSAVSAKGKRSTQPWSPQNGQQGLVPRAATWPIPQPQHIGATWQDKGVQFFIDHYVLGLPDEASDITGLRNQPWVFQHTLQQSMAAVGLAGLANLRSSKELSATARQMYGNALRDTGKVLARVQDEPIDFLIRNVLMLAMFEIVNGSDPDMSTGARTHMIGAAALLRSFFPIRNGSAMGLRGLLQLCYALLLSCAVADISLPPAFADWVSLSCKVMPKEEWPSTQLLPMVMQLVTLSRDMRGKYLPDQAYGEAHDVLKLLNDMDAQMEQWEASIDGKWTYKVGQSDFAPEACFRGLYHTYADNWTARIWNYYRWARLLACSMLLQISEKSPQAAHSALAATDEGLEARKEDARKTIVRMAQDILVSVPTHWKHPKLTTEHRDLLRCVGGAGTGAAGIPGLLFHIDVAASAPGVPPEFAEWGLGILDTVWSEMGMIHAKRLADNLRKRSGKSPEDGPNLTGLDKIIDDSPLLLVRRIKVEDADGWDHVRPFNDNLDANRGTMGHGGGYYEASNPTQMKVEGGKALAV